MDYFNAKTNFLYLSILLLVAISYLENNYLLLKFSFMWILYIIFVGNGHRLQLNSQILETLLRRLVNIIIIVSPIFIFNIRIYFERFSIKYLLVAFILGFLNNLIVKKINPTISNRIILETQIALTTFTTKQVKMTFVRLLSLLFFPIGEEIFFRATVLASQINFFAISVFISSIIFPLAHFSFNWTTGFKFKDVLLQIELSVISSVLICSSQSIYPSLLIHYIFNYYSFKKNYFILFYLKRCAS
ncbi:CPBP family intramembrane metalloprotease [Lactobacillus sp. CC-MHH1034]|uniref:CPBP family intramembrane glutamic endopeptidase n=1 Tax=Agrilactobacillus fermenti TaxID=2586909 RepID=UPI001E415DC7|nr:CPBP family intramembrane glutamic endopeptidase [Agrilactobacillus fermenti]MCD2257445.1 CPBP family intramembrane metalloprotease [Agrilactobacillus fermenti]